MTADRETRALSGDALPVVIQAAFEHPVPTVRAQIHAWLLKWIETLEPQLDTEDVRDALLEEKGTEIEPFVLSPRDLEIATLATRAAFSKRANRARFRIVSSETLGIHGGLVLSRSLRSYYVERAAWARQRRTPWRASFVAPGSLPCGAAPSPVAVTTRGTLGAAGWHVEVPTACWGDDIDVSALMASLEIRRLNTPRNSVVTRRDLVIREHKGTVRIETTGPESLMRLTAMAEQRQVLTLSSKLKSQATRVLLSLVPLTEEQITIPLLVTHTSRNTQQWAGFWADVSVPLPFNHREAIARVFPMHDSWVTPALVRRLI